jgi:hypothetical protein
MAEFNMGLVERSLKQLVLFCSQNVATQPMEINDMEQYLPSI